MPLADRAAAGLGLACLAEQWEAIGVPRVLVVGDLILDRSTWGEAGPASPEAPAPALVLAAAWSEDRLGGAAGVAGLLRALGAEVALAGVIGGDEAGACLLAQLGAATIDRDLIRVDPGRPTTSRHRLMGSTRRRTARPVVRLDTESTRSLAPDLEARLLADLVRALTEVDAVVIADAGKGTCTTTLVPALIRQARQGGVPVVLAPGPGVELDHSAGATCLLADRAAAAAAVGGRRVDTVAAAGSVAATLGARLRLEAAVLMLGRDGLVAAGADGLIEHAAAGVGRMPGGDGTASAAAVLAMLGFCAAAGLSGSAAVRLASLAGELDREPPGAALPPRARIAAAVRRDAESDRVAPGPAKLVSRSDLATLVAERRRLGERIVLANGCFDLLHPGHLRVLTAARRRGDCLVVGLNSDRSTARLKGPGRPIVPERDRAALLAALEVVDLVCLFDEPTAFELVAALRPDVLVQGGDYRLDQVVGRDLVEEAGGAVVLVPLAADWSTTRLVGRPRIAEPA